MQVDLWGNEIQSNKLKDRFLEPPFTVINASSDRWSKRKRIWKELGIQSEIGRDAKVYSNDLAIKCGRENVQSEISIFDPALCEVLYRWFVPDGGSILDPFAGGSVGGIVANYLGYKYTGIDIRPEQIESNYEQSKAILEPYNQPNWLVGDSNIVLDKIVSEFDFVFSCPPYADLEVYSDLEGDISNMDYIDFMVAYSSIINKACKLLKNEGLACFVVGEVRDKKGNYIGFVPDTIKAFREAGLNYYNEAILCTPLGSAMLRANTCMKNKKLCKVHQNILVFKKG